MSDLDNDRRDLQRVLDRAADLVDAYASEAAEHGMRAPQTDHARTTAHQAVAAALRATREHGARMAVTRVVEVIHAQREAEAEAEAAHAAAARAAGPWGPS